MSENAHTRARVQESAPPLFTAQGHEATSPRELEVAVDLVRR